MIEPLEPRVAPAAILKFADVDGDIITVKTSKGTADDLAAAATFNSPFVLHRITRLDLGAEVFKGTDVTISVLPQANGDGLTTVGALLTGHDLGHVRIAGDLGKIVAGDNAAGPAIKSLTLTSFGRFGTTSGADSLASVLSGSVASLVVKQNVTGVDFAVRGDIGSVTIGGSLQGGSAFHAGLISATGKIGAVKIGGNILGGAGEGSGQIYADGALGRISVGGSVVGGNGEFSGQIGVQGGIGTVAIKGNLQGGAGEKSGIVFSHSDVASVTIGGSMLGGAGYSSGNLSATGNVGQVKIAGSIIGGSGQTSGSIETAFVGGISIGQSLVGGTGNYSGYLYAEVVGSLKIAGDVVGEVFQERAGSSLPVRSTFSEEAGTC